MDAMNVAAKFEVRSFTPSWDNSDWSFGWGLRTPNLGEEAAVEGPDGTVRKSIGEFLWALHSNFCFSTISMRFRDIAVFVLQHATFSHPTSIVSPKFPRVPIISHHQKVDVIL